MLKHAYITKIAKFLPNEPVGNDEMEEYLGKIKGLRSRSKAIVLRNNGIKCRYYAQDKEGKSTHSNLDLTVEAIKSLNDSTFNINEIELITCGSASPDQAMPSMSSMVHGALGIGPIDSVTATGSCNASMWGLNYAWMSILTGKISNAVCTGTEKMSSWMTAKNFEEESKHLEELGRNPYVAFEKDFLRWMLSDGSAAVLLQDKPAKNQLSLKIDWLEIKSYANEVEACMYSGAIKDENGGLIPWRDIDPQEWLNQSVFSLKQDSKLLEKNITRLGALFLKELVAKHSLDTNKIDFFLPHISSFYFKEKIDNSLKEVEITIPEAAWFMNLEKIGNVGAASAFLMLEEVFNTKELKKGQTILVMVPESARFSYTYVHLTVV
jgi:3-oxoacyl-[acyl-carrier-protein] synthase III